MDSVLRAGSKTKGWRWACLPNPKRQGPVGLQWAICRGICSFILSLVVFSMPIATGRCSGSAIAEQCVYIGTAVLGERLRVNLQLTSSGADTILIKEVKSSCNCVTIHDYPASIQSSKPGQFLMEFYSASTQGRAAANLYVAWQRNGVLGYDVIRLEGWILPPSGIFPEKGVVELEDEEGGPTAALLVYGRSSAIASLKASVDKGAYNITIGEVQKTMDSGIVKVHCYVMPIDKHAVNQGPAILRLSTETGSEIVRIKREK